MSYFSSIKTPCIGVCSTGIGDSVCRGCKRVDYEVIQWNAYTESQKAAIDRRLSQLMSSVVASRLQITDAAQLAEQMRVQQIRYAEYRDPYCWLYELLRAGASQILSCEVYGFVMREQVRHLSLPRIRDEIERELYELSVAHYERYAVANQSRAVRVSEEGAV